MQKPALLLAVIFSATLSQAQIKIAIVGGGHSSTIKESNDLPGWDSLSNNYKGRTGFHFGFIADLKLGEFPLHFQPGVIYYNKGRKYSGVWDTTIVEVDTVYTTVYTDIRRQFLNYIDIPLNIVYKLNAGKRAKFMLGAGPYLSFFYNGKEKREQNTLNVDNSFISEETKDLPVGNKRGQYKTFDYGINALAGIEIGRVFLTLNYNRGLGEFFSPKDYESNLKHQVVGGTLGIFIGRPVEAEKKIKDKDKDGFAYDVDKCIDIPGTLNGCPDKDADGIADNEDKCVDVPGTAKYNGCPVPDSDGDGLNDEEDKCPQVPGLAKYTGCPVPDTDNDGIDDEEDRCPAVAGVKRYNGCPVPDSDNDGINDEEDKCPTVAGVKENNGCPQIKEKIIEQVKYAARRIQFEKAQANLLPASYKVLDEVASILKSNPDLKLMIEGHTSNDGNREANMILSQQRAENVKEYLITQGIDASRLQAVGYGPDKPIADNKSAEGKKQNRRVALIVSNQ